MNSPAQEPPETWNDREQAQRRDRRHWSDRVPVENLGDFERRRAKARYSRQLIDETIEVWQPYYDKKLSDEDAREIIENMAAFFGALMGWRGDLRNRVDPD